MVQERPTMLVAVDDSAHSEYALEWTLDHFFTSFGSNRPFQLLVIHARPLPSSVIGLTGPVRITVDPVQSDRSICTKITSKTNVVTFSGAASAEVVPIMKVGIKKTATMVKDKVKEICRNKSLSDVRVEVLEGDPRNVVCEAVEKYHAAILVLGSHGYGTVRRAILGSVSDYCAHHAHCSVMIVKKPKQEN
ncbi:UspA - like 10 [Theobroma cacao]|nr:UspA - like 10 [Theobroma cacao]